MRRTRPPLILASASPQRHAILKRLGVPFRVIPSRASERSGLRDPLRLVVALALRKAAQVAREHPQAAVLGADTIVFCRGRVIVKPRSRSDSERILRLLNGSWHRVYTGVALVLEGGRLAFTECAVTRVRARKMSEVELMSLAGKHMDKAGGYAVQDRRDPFIQRVSGDHDNVVGLPLRSVRRLWKRGLAARKRAVPRKRAAHASRPRKPAAG
ncbi:MAG: septum formation protein Maf [Elusimicrobia bacterium]|nr:septum formation protein Maf [Elusimicrobiota bacterium]